MSAASASKNYAPRAPDMNRWAMYQRVGAKLKALRLAKGQNLQAVATALASSAGMIHKMENGEAPPPLYLIVAAAKYFGVGIEDIVVLADETGDDT